MARRFSFLLCALDLPGCELAWLGTGADLRTAGVAVRQPSSSERLCAGASSFPTRSKPHISHSRSAMLFKKVHRGHSHSSLGRKTPAELEDDLLSGLRETLIDGAAAGPRDVALGGAEPVLACFGGKPTSYNKRAGPWSHQQVRCGVCASEACAGSAVNVYREKDPAAGGWGGNCLCPNGRIFAVGDNGVDGTSLACEGGVFDPKAINQHEGEWSRKR